MGAIVEYWPTLLSGAVTTVLVAALSIAGCAVASVVLGSLRFAGVLAIRIGVAEVVECFRGASALIFLFWFYYALPLLGAPQWSPFVVSIAVLSLVGGAYGAEIVSGGLAAVPRGQVEAARTLGLSSWQILRAITLPQALAQIVPAFGSLAVDMVKWTAIVSFVGVPDLLYVANAIRAVSYETVSVYLTLALIYWGLCSATSLLFAAIERCLPMSKALRAAAGTKPAARPGLTAAAADALARPS